jgi:hypothetical protein
MKLLTMKLHTMTHRRDKFAPNLYMYSIEIFKKINKSDYTLFQKTIEFRNDITRVYKILNEKPWVILPRQYSFT